MKAHLLKSNLESFNQYLQEPTTTMEYDIFPEISDNWLQNFDPQADDLASTYDNALKSNISGRLWKGNYNSPKSKMIELIKAQPELMRIAFMDLLSEDGDLSLRMGRFIHYCDEALDTVMKQNKKFNTHGQDRYMMSLYLSLNFPERYGLLVYRPFERAMQLLEVTPAPLEDDVERSVKLLRNISKFCHQNEVANNFYEKAGYNGNKKMVIIANELIHFMNRKQRV